jgi:hypothetical protein
VQTGYTLRKSALSTPLGSERKPQPSLFEENMKAVAPNSDTTLFPMDCTTSQVYGLIRHESGRVRTADLDAIFGNRKKVRNAITRLTTQHKIRRVRGFGREGIEYYYRAIS